VIAKRPSWQSLFEIATEQAGYVTTAQAAEAGYSPQLLHKYLANGRILRVRRGIYRLTHFIATEDEDLVVPWLWTDRQGVFSHETALIRHDLSDVLPQMTHLTVPEGWRRRRLRLPPGIELHYADVGAGERTWYGPVPITTPARTVNDCAIAALQPDLVGQAVEQGLTRGLFTVSEVEAARQWLRTFEAKPA
jgi:predicted transcriptional regulator of viral defense system